MQRIPLHDISVHFMNKDVVESLCEVLGEVQKSMKAVDNEGGYFIRVQILIDVTLPLCRGKVITMENGDKNWVSFKYERLPNFCFWCGRLTHGDKNCDLWLDSKGTLLPEQQQFRSNLKTALYTTMGKSVIYVSGFYEGRKSGTHKSLEARAQSKPVVVAPMSGPS